MTGGHHIFIEAPPTLAGATGGIELAYIGGILDAIENGLLTAPSEDIGGPSAAAPVPMLNDRLCEETERVIPKGFDTVGGPDEEDGGPDPALACCCAPAAPNI